MFSAFLAMNSLSFRRSPSFAVLVLACAAGGLFAPQAQAANVFRCGNEYTNHPQRIGRGGCVPVTGGAVTIVRDAGRGGARAMPVVARSQPRRLAEPAVQAAAVPARNVVADAVQRARDGGARGILQAELGKAMQRLGELRREYNNGEPERMGSETRNYQKYLDRVAGLRASIQRAEGDVAGIQRELGRSGS